MLFQAATCNMLIIITLHCIDCVGGRCFAPQLCRCFRQYR